MRVVILGSGRGSNAKSILEAEKNGELGTAQVVGIFADVEEAGILKLGEKYGTSAQYLSCVPYKTKLDGESEQNWISEIANLQPDLVVLAGFMRVVKEPFISAFENKIINLHPSLLPSFPGLHAIDKAFEMGVKITGCTVHWVNVIVDGGKIIEQASVRIEEGDDLGVLEGKVHQAEHSLLPSVIKGLSFGLKN